MAKFLALVEVDTGVEGEESNLFKIAETMSALGALGEHITVDKFVNLSVIERHDNVRVSKKVWGHDDTYQVIEHQVNFEEGTYLEMILLPSDGPAHPPFKLQKSN